MKISSVIISFIITTICGLLFFANGLDIGLTSALLVVIFCLFYIAFTLSDILVKMEERK